MSLLVRGGRVVDPASNTDAQLDVLVRDGCIAAVGERLEAGDAQVLDARGSVVAPGFIDMHVHLREPGEAHKETIASGTAAAAAGGFTAVGCMPNTVPAIDSAQTIGALLEAIRRDAVVRVYPIAAITAGRRGHDPVDFVGLAEAGAVAFSDDGTSVKDAATLAQAARAARDLRQPFISHCEDESLKAAFPRATIAEDAIVARDLTIAGWSGKNWHIAHLSSAFSVDAIRSSRRWGSRVTCEVTPHHLLLPAEDGVSDGTRKVNPPLRSEHDCAALRAAVREGVVDAFATDHAPHEGSAKTCAFDQASAGFSGLEIALGAYAKALPDLPAARFVELLSTAPARILGVPGGKLMAGEPADITVFADRRWTVKPERFHSKGRNTPFAGARFERKAVATIVGGEIVMRDGEILQRVAAR